MHGQNKDRLSKVSRSSNLASGQNVTDVEIDYSSRETEMSYPAWWTRKRLFHCFYSLPEDVIWNCYICLLALLAIVWVAIGLTEYYIGIYMDIFYNVNYGVHVIGACYHWLRQRRDTIAWNFWNILGLFIDVLTFSHFLSAAAELQLVCYYLRLHRPFRYLFARNDYNQKGSVLETTLKYCYIFMVLRVTWALVWINIDKSRPLAWVQLPKDLGEEDTNHQAMQFLVALYLVNKMFIPIGPSVPPANDIERLVCLLVMLSGCLVVVGSAIATLSLAISLYMRPEETFRARYRLIIKEMKQSHIPPSQREKVETFYRMYWHKQGAVSATQLLPTFPPALPAAIYTDIYFEATQKSRILRDLSYQLLSELAKKMETKHFIPGDPIIVRSSKKTNVIYITYGDIEMVTAEDDSTAILRMTRGTVLTPCGVCAPAGLGRAHLKVRAATFCTAHVLKASDLWRVVVKHGRNSDEAATINRAFNEHLKRVKRHYNQKTPEIVKHKSSILHFKRCLMALKEETDANGNLLLARPDVFLEIAGCYIMRNISRAEVSSVTDEADAICLRPTFPCILQPTSSLQVVWNSFVAALIVAVCFIHPYYLVFKKTVPIEFRFFDYVVTAIYVLDCIVYLSTGANVEEGVPITFAQTSSQQMRSHWFALDVLGTVPIFEFIGTGHFAGTNKILRLHKVFRVLKDFEDICVYRSHVLRFLSYTLLLFIACYLIAALQQGFMCYQFGYCLVTNFTHSPYWEHKPLDEDTVENRVAFGLYWAISMIMFTTHMETWGTEKWSNVLYTMFVLEICIVLRIFMEAVYSATVMVTTSLSEDYDACISTVKNFLIRNRVDPILRQRFIEYLQLCWFTDKAYSMTNKKSIFFDLPQHVYQDIVARQRSKYILSIPFMKFLHQEDLKNISSMARLFYTSPNEIMLNTGDICNEMYVIRQGICEILSPETKTVIGYLSAKDHFGVLVCLLRIPAYYTIRAVTHVQVFSISRKHLLQAIEIPKIKDAIDYVKELPEYHRLQGRREPFVSYQLPEPTPNTERFRLPRKHEQDYAFLHPFTKLGFLSVLRYIFPRFTIRPDGKYMMRYEWFRACCGLASAMVFPSYTYLVLQWPALYYITTLLDFTAYFDILQRMLVGYFNEQGILIYHPSSTAAHYLKGAFIVDLLACVSLENLESVRQEIEASYRVTQMEQFLMLNRLLQLYRLPGAMRVLHEHIERKDIIIILKAFPLFMVLLNVLTCFIVLYSANIYDNRVEGKWLIEPSKDQGGSWIELFGNEFRFNMTASPWNLHLAAYFWVVYEATTTGYNKFNPSNLDLMRVIFCGMLIGAMMLTYFSVRIISIRANVNKTLAEFQDHMKDMVAFMRREGLKAELQKEVMDYYEYNWDKLGGVDHRSVFKLCAQITLRTDAILHIYGPTFGQCPILSQCDASLLRIVGRAVHSAYFRRGMNIVEASDVISNMYFVAYGGLEASEKEENMSNNVKLCRGSVFGNLDGASTTLCPVTVVATSKVHLLMINSKTFHEIISDFPDVQDLIKNHRPDNRSSYIMGNAGDTIHLWPDRPEAPAMTVRSRQGLIKHLFFKGKFFQIYLIIVSLLCVYVDTYNAGFQINSAALISGLYALDFLFALKILLQYMLPVLADSASVRKVLIPARKSYFQGEFKYDVISLIPFEILCLFDKRHRWMIFSWLRLNRMFRIVTVYKCLKRRHQRITVNLILSTVFSVCIWFSLFVHTTACIWYFIGVMEDEIQPKSSWIHKDDGSLWCQNVYICSMYFVLTTFTQNGVGDIMPKKQSEVIFVCILEIIATLVYMMYVGEFSNIIQYQSFRTFSFYSKYLELQEFLKNNRVSKNLVNIVNKYSLHLWRESRGMQSPHFLQTAPPALRLRVMSAAYLHHLTRHHVFEACEPEFLRQLVGCLQLYTYNEKMYVVKASEITDSMYFIHKGKVEEINEGLFKAIRTIPAGSYFGVMQGLMEDIPYNNSYRTVTKSQVLTLRLDDWLYLLKHFPVSREIINNYVGHDDNKPSSYGSDDGWPPKPPKPRVTEIIDKGSPPTPPPDQDKQKPKFIPPSGPTAAGPRDSFSALQPELWPDTNRRRSSSSEELSAEKRNIAADKLSQRSSLSQLSNVSSLRGLSNVEDQSSEQTPLKVKVMDTAKKLTGKKYPLDEVSHVEGDKPSVKVEQEEEATTSAFYKEFNADRKGKDDKDGELIELITKETTNQALYKTSEESIFLSVEEEKKEEKIEKHLMALKTTRDSPITDTTEVQENVKLELQVENPPVATTLQGSDDKEKENTINEKKDVATSTSKMKKRHIRVRYEDDEGTRNRAVDTDNRNSKKQSRGLSVSQRNLRVLDSDTQLNRPELDEEEDDSASTIGSTSSSISKKVRYRRPSESK